MKAKAILTVMAASLCMVHSTCLCNKRVAAAYNEWNMGKSVEHKVRYDQESH
ncbi:hypothetical protein [Paenibacillus sp. FSL H7-0331]|uniref:hypothetical protein n=1 Tax=Paenibacillus sp. FSL H7-0331 TaxID=1920421 RepID=UPI0015C2D362|nr:hypothetical protein [Paenibacillus sp. FSL H7-0331]